MRKRRQLNSSLQLEDREWVFADLLASALGFANRSEMQAEWFKRRLREEMRARPELLHRAATCLGDSPGDGKLRFAG